MKQKHDSYVCPPHVEGCDCEDKDNSCCNPYWVAGFCPTDGEGENCTADWKKLKRVPVGPHGFTYEADRG